MKTSFFILLLFAVINFNPAQAQLITRSTSLINPPNSSVNLSVNGNQNTDLTLRNNNILGVTLRVTERRTIMPVWSTLLLPFSSRTRTYSIFGEVPIFWSWNISTVSDAASVLITASWFPFF